MQALVHGWCKCIANGGDSVENKCFVGKICSIRKCYCALCCSFLGNKQEALLSERPTYLKLIHNLLLYKNKFHDTNYFCEVVAVMKYCSKCNLVMIPLLLMFNCILITY